MTTYKIIRHDNTIHSSNLTVDDVLNIAGELDYDIATMSRTLRRRGEAVLADDIGQLTIKKEFDGG